MEVIKIDCQEKINKIGDLVLCAGFFDGLHQGHLSLIKKTLEIAESSNLVPALLTFDVNPLVVLKIVKEDKVITTVEDRARILEELGIKKLIVLKFNKCLSELPPQEFVSNILLSLGVKFLVCGFDYHFGKGGKGNPEDIKGISNNQIEVEIIKAQIYNKEKISSSTIHRLLDEGNIELVNFFLTRKFKVSGEVVTGANNGKKYGTPTANIKLDAPYHLPNSGVYSVEVKIDGKLYQGIANIGYHPTFKKLKEKQLEVNIFDFSANIYGEKIDVFFLKFIREEKKFDNIESLYAQIELDKKKIR